MTEIQILYEGPIVKRAEAKDQGLKRYFTGKPCKYGHVDERWTRNGGCRECTKRQSIKWKSENKDHLREYNKKYVEENRDWYSEYCRIYNKSYYEDNKEKIVEYKLNWWKDNRDSQLEKKRKRYISNREEILEKQSEYRKENPDKIRQQSRNAKARRKGADGKHTNQDILDILDIQCNKCAEPTCQKDLSDGYHVDHIMPLALGGSNWPENLQCLCPTCNLRKHAKHPYDWAQENGRLF